jgi:hypothetical protein
MIVYWLTDYQSDTPMTGILVELLQSQFLNCSLQLPISKLVQKSPTAAMQFASGPNGKVRTSLTLP